MILFYDLAAFGLLLLSLPYYGWRMLRTRKYRSGLKQRLGVYPKQIRERLSRGEWVWVHAVSLGEVNAVRPLLRELKSRLPDHEILVSTVTDTGQARAGELPEVDATIYLPLDLGCCIHGLLAFFRPRMLIIAETELWPRLAHSVSRGGVPVCLVNGRISDRSYPRYRRVRFLTSATFRSMRLVGMQTEEDARRAKSLGAPEQIVQVTGNLKFDSVKVEPVTGEERAALRREWGIGENDRVILGGSTWPGEEASLLAAYRNLLHLGGGVRLMIAPRHLERLDEVLGLIRQQGFGFRTRTGTRDDSGEGGAPPVLVLDTTGELARTYAIAEVAFVGKSLTETGGQNPLEPAGQGVAVCFGRNMQNFRDIAPGLVDAGAAEWIEGPEEILPVLQKLLADPDGTRRMGENAREFVEQNAGPAARTADQVLRLLQD